MSQTPDDLKSNDERTPDETTTNPSDPADSPGSPDDLSLELGGHIAETERCASVAPALPPLGGPMSSLDAEDVGSVEFSLSEQVNRSLQVAPALAPLPLDFGPRPTLRAPLLEAAAAAAARPARAEHSLNGFGVLVIPFYYKPQKRSTAALGTSSPEADLTAATAIGEALGIERVDFEVRPDIAEWTCAFADGSVHCDFGVRLWHQEQAGGRAALLLESTRQAGDASAFFRLHKALVARVTGAPAVPAPAPVATMPLPPLDPPPLEPAAHGSLEDDLARVVDSVVENVQAGGIDTVFEGTKCLAALSSDPAARPVLHSKGVVALLVALLQEKPAATMGHYGVCSELFAVTCLANLSEEPMCQASLTTALALLLERVTDGTFESRASGREAARALRNVAQDSSGADAIISAVGKEKLGAWVASSFPQLADPQMKDDAEEVKRNVEGRWAVACS